MESDKISAFTCKKRGIIDKYGPIRPKELFRVYKLDSRSTISKWVKEKVENGVIEWVDKDGYSFIDSLALRKAKHSGRAYLKLIDGVGNIVKIMDGPDKRVYGTVIAKQKGYFLVRYISRVLFEREENIQKVEIKNNEFNIGDKVRLIRNPNVLLNVSNVMGCPIIVQFDDNNTEFYYANELFKLDEDNDHEIGNKHNETEQTNQRSEKMKNNDKVQIGDTVEVLSGRKEGEYGKVLTNENAVGNDEICLVQFSDGEVAKYKEHLEKRKLPQDGQIRPNNNLRGHYGCLHKNSGIEVGDTVKVLRKAISFEMGWDNAWTDQMDELVGNEYKVTENCGKCGFLLDANHAVPFFVLEKIADQKGPEDITYEDALRLHYKMWYWLANHASDKEGEEDVPPYIIEGFNISDIFNKNFLCQYMNNKNLDCEECTLYSHCLSGYLAIWRAIGRTFSVPQDAAKSVAAQKIAEIGGNVKSGNYNILNWM